MERGELNGVPVWTTRVPGVTQAGLVFGVGMIDEPLPVRGISHFCEHLVLSTLDRSRHAFNGWTGPDTTTFATKGTFGDVAAFIDALVASIAAPPLERLETERTVLLAEGDLDLDTPFHRLLETRYGVASWGRLAYGQFGLDSVDEPAIATWLRDYFHAANASLWIAGPDPEVVLGRLTAELDRGRWRPPRQRLRPVIPLPGHIVIDDGVALSFTGDRNDGFGVATGLLFERLHEQIRHERGLAYHFGGDYHPLTKDEAHGYFAIRADDHARSDVTSTTYAVIDDFVRHGPTPDEMDRMHRQIRTLFLDPGEYAASASIAAEECARGYEPQLVADDLWRWRLELEPEAIRSALAGSMGSLLLGTPAEARPNPAYPRVVIPNAPPLAGASETFRTNVGSGNMLQLSVGAGGVSLRDERGFLTTVRSDACAGLFVFENGDRYALGEDGQYVTVIASRWRHGTRLAAAIDSVFPRSIWIHRSGGFSGFGQVPLRYRLRRTGRGVLKRGRAVLGIKIGGIGVFWWIWIVAILVRIMVGIAVGISDAD